MQNAACLFQPCLFKEIPSESAVAEVFPSRSIFENMQKLWKCTFLKFHPSFTDKEVQDG